MKIKEYVVIIEEQGGILRITGQFKIPNKLNKDKNLLVGRALHSAKAGEIVTIRI